MAALFEGSYVALTTPFRGRAVDLKAWRRLVARQIEAGTHGLVPCGSTGEAATLHADEYAALVKAAVHEARGRVPVVAGVGSNATDKTVEQAKLAEKLGADALLVLVPYYNKPAQEGLYLHFRAVSRAVRRPIVVYNIPGRTAVNLLPATLARLAADCANIAAVKEASGSLDQVSEIVGLTRRDFCVLSGDDSLTLPMMSVGARGVVSVVANVAPAETAELCSSFLKGGFARARELHHRLLPLVKALFLETNPIPVKAAMGMLGLGSSDLRLPLTPLGEANAARLRQALKDFGLKPR